MPTSEQIEKARNAVQELANVEMNLSLGDWGRISNAILGAIPQHTASDIERAAKELAFAGRMEHDMSSDADDFWEHTVEDSRARYLCMARAALHSAEGVKPRVKPLVSLWMAELLQDAISEGRTHAENETWVSRDFTAHPAYVRILAALEGE